MNILQTDIMLVVRVSVLSEQMTEVQPRVSTDGSDLTMILSADDLRKEQKKKDPKTKKEKLKKNKSVPKYLTMTFLTANLLVPRAREVVMTAPDPRGWRRQPERRRS